MAKKPDTKEAEQKKTDQEKEQPDSTPSGEEGHQELMDIEEMEGTAQPGEAKPGAGIGAVAPGPDQSERHQQHAGPKDKRAERQVEARRRAVGFMAAQKLGQQVAGHRALKEPTIGYGYGDEPGGGDGEGEGKA